MENQEILSEFKNDHLQINTEFKIDDKTKKWVKGVLTSAVATLTFTKKYASLIPSPTERKSHNGS